jgi:exosortase N
LTRLAAALLHLINNDYSASGNLILIGNSEFRVDPECLGLNMISSGLVLILMYMAYLQNIKHNNFNIVAITGSLLLTFFFVLISNLFRIVMIVLFKSCPETVSHNVIGLGSFIIYCLLPMFFIINRFSTFPCMYVNPCRSKYYSIKIHWIIIVTIIAQFTIIRFTNISKETLPKLPEISTIINECAYHKTILYNEVIKYENDSAIIYIKPLRASYVSEHHPKTCWRGAGYTISNDRIKSCNTTDIFYGELSKGKDTLYTAWWYESSKEHTISQLRWRTMSLVQNRPYNLINFTSYNKAILEKLVSEHLDMNASNQ